MRNFILQRATKNKNSLNQIQIVKEKLNSAITQLCETSWMFVKDPTVYAVPPELLVR